MEGFSIIGASVMFSNEWKRVRRIPETYIIEYAGNIAEFEWYNQAFKSLHQCQMENVHFPPSSFSLSCMICVSGILERPSLLHDYHLLSICHMPDAMQGT